MRALLAYESGYGLGHLTRLSEIARRLKRRNVNCVLASYRLDDAESFAENFEDVVQSPVWPSFFASERALTTSVGPSFATVLTNMGFHEPRYVTINQRAWRSILDRWQIDIVVADFAPGAVLAGFGRCPTVQIGAPFATPSIGADGIFPAYLEEESVDGDAELQIFAGISEGLHRIDRSAPGTLGESVIAQRSFPSSFEEFDPFLKIRKEPLLFPDNLPAVRPICKRGEMVFVYLPEWMGHNDLLMASLLAVRLPTRVFMPFMAEDLKSDFRNRGLNVAEKPFSLEELARDARLFLHHGGLGSCQIGLLAGVPQLVLESDMEKIVNGRALRKLGAGQTMNYHRITVPKVRQAATDLFESYEAKVQSQGIANAIYDRFPDRHPLDVIVDGVVAICH